MKAYSNAKNVNGQKDIILIATKANVLPMLVESLSPLLKKDSVIVSMQNGIKRRIPSD